jgi:hypothetical protein
MGFASFMASAFGRGVRIIAGLALIGGGLALAFGNVNTTLGVALAIVGLVPLAAGMLDFCVFAPLFGAPFSGSRIRARQGAPAH